MHRNVSDDGHMLKERKLYSSRGNDGYVTKTVAVQLCKNLKTKNLSAMFPRSTTTTMSSSVQSTLLLGVDSLIASQNTRTRGILLQLLAHTTQARLIQSFEILKSVKRFKSQAISNKSNLSRAVEADSSLSFQLGSIFVPKIIENNNMKQIFLFLFLKITTTQPPNLARSAMSSTGVRLPFLFTLHTPCRYNNLVSF